MQMWQEEHAEKVYYSDKVTSTGQIIAGIVAKNKRAAQKGKGLANPLENLNLNTLAASLVKVEYEDISPAILTLSDAIKHNTSLEPTFTIENGDVDEALKNAKHTIKDVFTVGGQEHFYFEPYCGRAEPVDSTREVIITASTQWQALVQVI